MENLLSLAKREVEEAEIFVVTSEETPVHFEANHLKNIQNKQRSSIALRVIKNGRLGFAAASGKYDEQTLIKHAVETSQFGQEAKFELPRIGGYSKVEVEDPEVEDVTIEEMVELGEKMITKVNEHTAGIVCEAVVVKEITSVNLANTKGGRVTYRKSTFGLGVSGTLVKGTDMLFVGDGQESCHPIKNQEIITDKVLKQLELAKNNASVPSRVLPVIFTPDGAASALLPSLLAAFNGKMVLEGASPIAKKLGQKVFDGKLSMKDDGTIPFRPQSRPCDEEGVISQSTGLIKGGIIAGFLYDLQTAGLANTKSTGNGSRVRGGVVAPSPSSIVVAPGDVSFEDMVHDIKEGVLIEQLMGAEQGNILGGDFSGNVLLGFKIESGKIVGRIKDTIVSGNVYQALQDIVAIGTEPKWVGSAVNVPPIYLAGLSVASK